MYDSSTADLLESADIFKSVWAFDDSELNLNGGRIGGDPSFSDLIALHNSRVNIFAGHVQGDMISYNFTQTNVYGGVIDELGARDSSILNIHGGTIDEVDVLESATVNLFGGTIRNIGMGGQGKFGRVAFHGRDFRATGDLTIEEDRVIGGNGTLHGKWLDGTAFEVGIGANMPSSTIWAVPEPSAVILWSLMALLGLVCWRGRHKTWT